MLKQLRRQMNVSQMQAANHIGISVSHYRKIECGQRSPSLEVAARMAEYFNESISHLFLRA
jgi:putative transcriptional regulator